MGEPDGGQDVVPHGGGLASRVGATGSPVDGLEQLLAGTPSPLLDQAIESALATLGQHLGSQRVWLSVLDGDVVTTTHEWVPYDVEPRIDDNRRVPVERVARWLGGLRDGTHLQLSDVADAPAAARPVLSRMAGPWARSLLVVPLLSFGEVLGALAVVDHVPRTFTSTERATATSVADLVASAWVRREARSSIVRTQARVEELLRHVDDILFALDADGRCTWASGSISRLGMSPEQVRGVVLRELLVDDDAAAVREQVREWRATDPSQPMVLDDVQLVTPLGVRWVAGSLRDLRHVPGVEGDLLVVRDVTERRHSQSTSRRNALTDAMTRLPNRAAFRTQLHVMLSECDDGVTGLLHVDLDGFRRVNDVRGQAFGDELLRSAASRLWQLASDGEMVARLGGDEFAVALRGCRTDDVQATADRFVRALASPFFVDGAVETVTASAGLRLRHPDGTAEVDELLRDADTALFVAKERGRDRMVVFDPSMAVTASRRSNVAARLRRAVESGLVQPAYQPIVALPSMTVVGAEALARWTDPELSEVHPSEFIPIAEETGLVQQLGLQMLQQAATDAMGWPRPLTVSVNVSARQLEDPALASQIVTLLRGTGTPPERVRLEVTESMLMRDPKRARSILSELREIGLSVALDDFGTGHSSLAVLRDLPLDVLKIDRSFVGTLHADERNRAIVATIVDMARHFGLATVAEGVELPVHAEVLAEAGCDYSQGWLHGRPTTPAAFATSLGRQAVRSAQPAVDSVG